jgi:hypothetical protein
MKAAKKKVWLLLWPVIAALQLLFAAQLAPAKSAFGSKNCAWEIFPLAAQSLQLERSQVPQPQRERAPPAAKIALDALLGPETEINVVAEQPRNALGQFVPINGGEVPPGSPAVNDFIQQATQNGWTLVDTEVSFDTPFGVRRYDAVLTDPNDVNWGFEIKSSEGAFTRWNSQQFAADRWINMQDNGATAIGKQLNLNIQGSVKVLWPTQ